VFSARNYKVWLPERVSCCVPPEIQPGNITRETGLLTNIAPGGFEVASLGIAHGAAPA
jgi:hypothetical protein